MTDVRLTATNPDDSSVVPVACNSRGELLVTEPVISEIDNNLTINGQLDCFSQEIDESRWRLRFNDVTGGLHLNNVDTEDAAWAIYRTGELYNYVSTSTGTGRVRIGGEAFAHRVTNQSGVNVFQVNWDGSTFAPSQKLFTEPDKPEHYSTVKNATTGEEAIEYIGPVLDVGEELVFLRAQVRSLMEKLKMTPEGGWPVWDGSNEI
jgi:hypothetical protein